MKPSPSIAVIGGGISGLAVAVRCSWLNIDKIAIFDAHTPGQNPSGIDAGLLHPFPGMRARMIPRFSQLQKKTMQLLQIAQKFVNQPLFSTCGFFRIATTPERARDFQRAAELHGLGLFPADLADYAPFQDGTKTGLWIEGATAVHLPRYQLGLWRYLKSRGAIFQKKQIQRAEDLLKNWEIVIIASGFGSADLNQRSHQLKPLRGQWFILKTPRQADGLKIGISDRAYAFPIPGEPNKIFAGSTFEHTDQLLTSPNECGEQLLIDCRHLIKIPDLKVERYGSSLRSFIPDHLPFVKWLTDRIGIITAMGSKGLARHADCADQLISSHLLLSHQSAKTNSLF